MSSTKTPDALHCLAQDIAILLHNASSDNAKELQETGSLQCEFTRELSEAEVFEISANRDKAPSRIVGLMFELLSTKLRSENEIHIEIQPKNNGLQLTLLLKRLRDPIKPASS